jgi:hypothetical protein
MSETHRGDTNGFRSAVCAWLEADGWVVRIEECGAGTSGPESHFPWLAIAYQEDCHLVVAAPASAPDALVISHFFTLEAADRSRIDRLPAEEQAELVWDLLSHLNLLQIDYVIDRPVPHEVLLMLKVVQDGMTRDLLLHRVLRLSAGLRMVLLAYGKALGTLVSEPAEAIVH